MNAHETKNVQLVEDVTRLVQNNPDVELTDPAHATLQDLYSDDVVTVTKRIEDGTLYITEITRTDTELEEPQ